MPNIPDDIKDCEAKQKIWKMRFESKKVPDYDFRKVTHHVLVQTVEVPGGPPTPSINVIFVPDENAVNEFIQVTTSLATSETSEAMNSLPLSLDGTFQPPIGNRKIESYLITHDLCKPSVIEVDADLIDVDDWPDYDLELEIDSNAEQPPAEQE